MFQCSTESFSRYRINFLNLFTENSLDLPGFCLDFISNSFGQLQKSDLGFKSPIPPKNGECMTIEFPLGRSIDGDTVCILPALVLAERHR